MPLKTEETVLNATGQRKREKVKEENCANGDLNPGLRGKKRLNLVDMTRSIGTRFHTLLQVKKEEKDLGFSL